MSDLVFTWWLSFSFTIFARDGVHYYSVRNAAIGTTCHCFNLRSVSSDTQWKILNFVEKLREGFHVWIQAGENWTFAIITIARIYTILVMLFQKAFLGNWKKLAIGKWHPSSILSQANYSPWHVIRSCSKWKMTKYQFSLMYQFSYSISHVSWIFQLHWKEIDLVKMEEN